MTTSGMHRRPLEGRHLVLHTFMVNDSIRLFTNNQTNGTLLYNISQLFCCLPCNYSKNAVVIRGVSDVGFPVLGMRILHFNIRGCGYYIFYYIGVMKMSFSHRS